MIPAPSKTLSLFIKRMAADLTPDGAIHRLELWHTVEGELGERLSTIVVSERPPEEDDECITFELWSAAYEDSGTRSQGALQRYVVQAFRNEGDLQPEDSRAFVIPGTAVSGLIGSSTEPPTPKGLLAAEMRQTETLHAMVIRMCEATAGGLAQQLREEREKNRELTNQSYELAKLREDLLDRRQERELRVAAEQRAAERLDGLLQLATSLAPVLMQQLMSKPKQVGGPAPPHPPHPPHPPPPPAAPAGAAASAAGGGEAAATERTAASPPPAAQTTDAVQEALERDRAVAQFLTTLTPEQMQTFIESLSTEQAMNLMSLYQAFPQGAPGEDETKTSKETNHVPAN